VGVLGILAFVACALSLLQPRRALGATHDVEV